MALQAYRQTRYCRIDTPYSEYSRYYTERVAAHLRLFIRIRYRDEISEIAASMFSIIGHRDTLDDDPRRFRRAL